MRVEEDVARVSGWLGGKASRPGILGSSFQEHPANSGGGSWNLPFYRIGRCLIRLILPLDSPDLLQRQLQAGSAFLHMLAVLAFQPLASFSRVPAL